MCPWPTCVPPTGTLSAMHDTARRLNEDEFADGTDHPYRFGVPTFNLSSDAVQASRLRLINPGEDPAAVTIGARDDTGAAATGGDVTLTLAGGGRKDTDGPTA